MLPAIWCSKVRDIPFVYSNNMQQAELRRQEVPQVNSFNTKLPCAINFQIEHCSKSVGEQNELNNMYGHVVCHMLYHLISQTVGNVPCWNLLNAPEISRFLAPPFVPRSKIVTADEAMSALGCLLFFGEGDGGALEHVRTCVHDIYCTVF